MNSINTQKLISSFLILSIAVSSSVLIFATNGASNEVQAEKVAITNELPSSAFADESIRQIAGFSTYNTLAAKDGKVQDNLTDYFAEKMLGQLAEDNSSGLINTNGKGVSFEIPDMDSGLGYFLKDPAVTLVASVNPADIKTRKENTPADIQKYFEEMMPIVETASKDFNDRLEFYSETAVTAASFSSLDFILSNELAKLYNVKVPTEVAEYHSAIIKTLKTRGGLTGLNNDPLRSYFYAQNLETMASIENKIMSDATGNLNKKLSLLFPKNGSSLFAKYIGVNQAMAWVDTGALVQRIADAITQNAQLFKTIWKYAQDLAINILKDVLIKKLVQQTINWANNGFNGKPQYVENFGRVINDTLKSAENRVLSDMMKIITGDGSCPRLVPAIKIAFGGDTSISPGISDSSYSCTVDQLGANLEDFKKSFSNGGWITLNRVLTTPQGSFLGSSIDIADRISDEQDKKIEDKKQDIQSGNGFLSMKKCKTPETLTAAQGAGQFETVEDAKKNLGDKFISATCATRCQTVTWCPKGDWETTTPGAIASKATTDALSQSPIASLVNIEDLGALASALVNAAITKLVGLAQEGVAGLTNKELASKGGTTSSLCTGYIDGRPRTPAEIQECTEEADGDIGGVTGELDELNAKNVTDGLNNLVSSYAEMAGTYNEILSKGGQAKYYLELASSTCSAEFISSTVGDVIDAGSYVAQNYDFVVGKIQEAEEKIPEIVGVEGSGGIINTLQELNDAIADKNLEKLKELNTSLALGVIFKETLSDDQNVANFVSKLSNQMESSASPFAKKFWTALEMARGVGDLKATSVKLADDACSILYTARRINLDPNSCSLSVAKADCNPLLQ